MQQQTMLDFGAEPNKKEAEQVAKGTSLPPPLVRPDRQVTFGSTPHYEWPEPEHDRDTITVDRISDAADRPDHRFIIERDDTVSVHFSCGKQQQGTVTGISHAKREVRISSTPGKKGIWHGIGYVYPAESPQKPPQNSKPLSAVVGQLNTKHEPDKGFTDADRVPDTSPYTFSEFKELWKTRGADLTFYSYCETFERIAASEEEIKSELKSTYKAPQLKAIASNLGDWNAKSNTKTQNADAVYRKMLSFFLLDGSVSFAMGGSYLDALKQKVRAVTEDDWKAHQEELVRKQAEHEAALSDPQNLADFAKFIRAKGEDALSNEQMARFDMQHADLARERRAVNGPSKIVTQFESEELGEVAFTVKEGYHDKRQCPLWIVQLGSRVERATFMELKTKAKMLGGWYSSFKKADAGFQFLTEDAAIRFTDLLGGDADREDILAARKERSELSASERLHELANTMSERADETIEASKNSLQNTARRADIQAGVRGRAYADQALARSLHSVATALSTGEANYLCGVRHKTHLETLDTVLYLAKWARIRAIRKADLEGEYGFGMRVQEEEEKPYSDDDIRFAEYPLPSIYKRHLEDAVAVCKTLRGAKQTSERMRKRIGRVKDKYVTFEGEYDIAELADFLGRAKSAGYDTQWMDSALEKYKRLQAAKIGDIHELRTALREYLPHKASVRGDDPVEIAERELIGKELPGFFPTPRTVIDEMLEYAAIESHHTVLEPSCGKGDIVLAIIQFAPEAKLTAIERNRTLADVLAAKGLEVEYTDFLEHQETYDRIVMNPPFENSQDIAHVLHAYSLLNATGGKLVSIMSEGPFFRTDRKSAEFRAWLDSVGGVSEKLPDGAFFGSDAFRKTGVATRIVEVTKGRR